MRLVIATVALVLSWPVTSFSRKHRHQAHQDVKNIVSHVDASSTLFPRSSSGNDDQLSKSDTAISFNTLTVIGSTRSDHIQKKVQQTHLGIPVFGHSFVIGKRCVEFILHSSGPQ